MKINRLLVLSFLLLSSFTLMMAQQVSADEAMARARAFMLSGKGPRRAPGKALPQLKLAYTQTRTPDEKVCFYVFNYSDDSGFIIMGGDESAREVLAYSDAGTFDYSKAPENFKWWLSQYEEQISEAMDNDGSSGSRSSRRKASAYINRHDISPLVKTTWDQEAPYWNAVNADMQTQNSGWSQYVLTGCVATAMAQAMNYHQWPEKGKGSKSYTKSVSSYTYTFSANFGETEYDWDNMLNDYSGSYTDAQADAVSTLMYHAGVSVNMTYGTGASSANSDNIASAISTYFGYDKSVRQELRTYSNDESWDKMLYNELSQNRPIIYAGLSTTSSGGHCFICDGYDSSNDTYHFNWGWGGYCDCYCPLTGTNAIKPGGSGSGGAGSQAAYSRGQEAIINVMPDQGGYITPVLANTAATLTLSDGESTVSSYTHTHGTSKTLSLTESVKNVCSRLTTFTLGVKATDLVNGREYYWANGSSTTLSTSASATDYTVNFDVDKIDYSGTYRLQLVARNIASTSDDDWYEVACTSSVTYPTVTVNDATAPDKKDIEFTISDTEVETTRTIRISADELYSGAVTYTSSDETIATVSADGVVTGQKLGQVKITAHGSGNIYFNETTHVFTVTVRDYQKEDVEAAISADGLRKGETAKITVTSGYDGTPEYETSDATVATVSTAGVVTAVAAGTATITVTIPETSKYNGTTATFKVTVTEDDIYLTETPYFSNDNNPWSGDANLNISVRNNTSSKQVVYFLMMLYDLTEGGKYVYGSGLYWPEFTASTTLTTSLNVNDYFTGDYKLVEGHKYSMYFMSKTDWKTEYNIPSITFTYRPEAEIPITMTSAGYGTLILPFDAEIPAKDDSGNALDWKAYGCDQLEGNVLGLKQVSSLKRNTPYILGGAVQGTYTFTGPEAVDSNPVLFSDGVLTGTMLSEEYAFAEGDYILQNQDGSVGFYKYTENSGTWYASPYRAFIQVEPEATFAKFAFPVITGIQQTTDGRQQTTAAGIYSVNGTRRTSLQPGLNIVIDEAGNARKLFIKK